MSSSSTATQRTYRYLRLSIIAAVLALFLSLVVTAVQAGEFPPSISAMIYTPGRTVFTGVLFAVALAFLALSGHSLAQALIDIAALLAVLIVVVPTPIAPGDIPGVDVVCAGGVMQCVPRAEYATLTNGMWTFAVLGLLAVAAILLLAVRQSTLSTGVWATAGVAVLVIVGASSWWAIAPDGFLAAGHFVATTSFFALVALVSALAARFATSGYRVLYAVIAIALTVDLIVLLVASLTHVPFVLMGEVIGLVLFAAFWVLQTAENWSVSDPSIAR